MEDKQQFPGFLDLLKNSWNIYKANLKLFLGLVGLFAVSSVLIVILAVVLAGLFALTKLTIIIAVVVIVLLIAIVAMQIWLQLSLLIATKFIVDRGEVGSFSNLLREARPLILPMAGISLISLFLTTGGLVLFIIPGIVFSIWFSFAVYMLVDEGRYGFSTLLASRDYIKGNVIKVLIRWFLFGIVTWLATGLVPIISERFNLEWLGSIYSIVAGLAIAPLSTIFGFLLFRAVKEQRPGLEPDLSRSRKLKYTGMAILGYVLIIALILFLATSLYRSPLL
jgi:hypothetical protein